MKINQEVVRYLKDERYSRQTLGRLCGVTTNTINRWIEKKNLKMEQLDKLCDGMGMVFEIYNGDEEIYNDCEDIAVYLKDYMRDHNITNEWMAEQLKINNPDKIDYYLGRELPKLSNIEMICNALGFTVKITTSDGRVLQ